MSELVDLAIQSDERGKAIDRCIVTLNHYGHEVTDDVSETIDHVCTAFAAAVAERDRLREALRKLYAAVISNAAGIVRQSWGSEEAIGDVLRDHVVRLRRAADAAREALGEGRP